MRAGQHLRMLTPLRSTDNAYIGVSSRILIIIIVHARLVDKWLPIQCIKATWPVDINALSLMVTTPGILRDKKTVSLRPVHAGLLHVSRRNVGVASDKCGIIRQVNAHSPYG